ncbi:hypothetical protein [uncultured Roseobacter sp.]|uniref:hypothetical protein n=1 Tax=uncultured Roseobacter sp. TaxID=114847 RepID=UPI0026363AEE|nr:hypothetical protein [uncultured Roseobacter sp.]
MSGKRFIVVPAALTAAVLLSACAQTNSSVITRDAQLQNVLDLTRDEDCWFDRIDYTYTAYLLDRKNGEELIDRLVEACPGIEVSFVAAAGRSGTTFPTPDDGLQLASEERGNESEERGRPEPEKTPADTGGPEGGAPESGPSGETPGDNGPESPEGDGGEPGTGGGFGGGNGGGSSGDDDGSGGGNGGSGSSGGGQSGGFSG